MAFLNPFCAYTVEELQKYIKDLDNDETFRLLAKQALRAKEELKKEFEKL